MKNDLVQIVNESGLDKSKAEVLLQNFQDYFALAAEWEQKAKVLVVTSETQVAEMKMAREGRLFLREKRVALEKVRKGLKEQSLREGKAIDGIANVLKALIVPIEKYLDDQEHFVDRREEEKREVVRLEVEARLEAERRAQERWLAAEQEQVKRDNARLRQEAEAKEKQMKAEREATRREVEKTKKRAAEIAIEAEAEVEAERLKAEKAAAREAVAEKERQEVRAKLAEEKAAAQKLQDEQIECPYCHKQFRLEDGKLGVAE